jgi:hypothetical protein
LFLNDTFLVSISHPSTKIHLLIYNAITYAITMSSLPSQTGTPPRLLGMS